MLLEHVEQFRGDTEARLAVLREIDADGVARSSRRSASGFGVAASCDSPEVPETWHHGLIATWWAQFNEGGPEIEYFQPYVEAGQPALDLGCGAGRLLLPWLRAGLDVDGCDASADMIAHCREALEREGLTSNLYVQSMHELDLPRRYRTIVVCGALGLGGRREETTEGLRRIYEHLDPGGTFVVDNEVPYAGGTDWKYWQRDARADLPRPWSEPPDERRRGADGAEYALRARLVAFDPLEQQTTYEMRAWMWRDGELVAEEEHRLDMTVYFTHEIVLMLERAGFADVELRAGYADREPTGDDDFVVFIARKPETSCKRGTVALNAGATGAKGDPQA